MRLTWLVVAFAVAAAAGCDKDAPSRQTTEPATPVALETPAATRPAPDAPVVVSVQVTPAGIQVGTTAGTDVQRIAPCEDGQHDSFALGDALKTLRERPALRGRQDIEIGAARGVSYESVVYVMDAAIGAGFADVGLVPPADLSVTFASDGGGEPVASRCPMPAAPVPGDAPAPAPSKPSGDSPLRKVPVIVITPDEVKLGDATVATVADVAAFAGEVFEPIRQALEKRPAELSELDEKRCACGPGTFYDEDTGACAAGQAPPATMCLRGVVILQADRTTDAAVLNKVMKSAHAANYTNVMFAVNRR